MRYFVLFLFYSLFLSAGEVSILPKQDIPSQSFIVPVERGSPLLSTYDRMAHGEQLLSREPFRFSVNTKGKGEVIAERPIILACFDSVDHSWHIVHVAIPFPVPESYFGSLRRAQSLESRANCIVPVRSLQSEYEVKHVKGVGATRLVIDVTSISPEGVRRPLVVYRMKFASIKGKGVLSKKDLERRVTAQTYTPLAQFFEQEIFVEEGRRLLRVHAQVARAALENGAVPSLLAKGIVSGSTFADVVPLALAISEQWDPLFFKLEREASMRRVLAEYGLNREQAFMWSTSSANAIGCLQFTNVNSNGTYAMVVRSYPKAKLNPSFEPGARDMHNVFKAAICLLDYEAAHDTRAKKLLQAKSELGVFHSVAAYNGGGSAGRKLLDALFRLNRQLVSMLNVQLLKIPRAIAGSRKGKQNTETPMYMEKYIFLVATLGT